MSNFMIKFILITSFLIFAASCSSVKTTNPGTIGLDRKQYMSPLVPEAKLNEGAIAAYAEVLSAEKSKGTLNADRRLTARVRKIADRIIPKVTVFRPQAAKWNWEVNVIDKNELNAWCMPGGKIAFYSGIVNQLSLTDDEIAAIMGHEIAHALREHARERASEQATSGLLITAGAVAIGAGSSAVDMAGLAYNMARASGASGPEWLSTHPSSQTRIADLRQYAKRVQPLYIAATR